MSKTLVIIVFVYRDSDLAPPHPSPLSRNPHAIARLKNSVRSVENHQCLEEKFDLICFYSFIEIAVEYWRFQIRNIWISEGLLYFLFLYLTAARQ